MSSKSYKPPTYSFARSSSLKFFTNLSFPTCATTRFSFQNLFRFFQVAPQLFSSFVQLFVNGLRRARKTCTLKDPNQSSIKVEQERKTILTSCLSAALWNRALWTVGCAVLVTDATAAATADEIEVATAEDAVLLLLLLLLALMTFAVLMLAKLCDVTTVPMLVLEAGGGGPPDGGAETEGVLLTGGCCFFLNESCSG